MPPKGEASPYTWGLCVRSPCGPHVARLDLGRETCKGSRGLWVSHSLAATRSNPPPPGMHCTCVLIACGCARNLVGVHEGSERARSATGLSFPASLRVFPCVRCSVWRRSSRCGGTGSLRSTPSCGRSTASPPRR